MSENNKPIKTKHYLNKDFDAMSAEELRHGALKWLNAEAKGEGLGDEKAAKASKIKQEVMGEGKKDLRARITALEQQIKAGGS